MEEVSCVGVVSRSTLLAGYRPLDDPWDDVQPMLLSSSEDGSESSFDPDSGSEPEGSCPSVAPPMSDSLDLHPLLGLSQSDSDATAPVTSSLSRHVPSWVMRTQQDDSNANVLPPKPPAMPRLCVVTKSESPISPAIEKAEIERSEKPVEINGNLTTNTSKDGVRPKTVQNLKISRHAPGGNVGNGGITRSPKHRRSAPEPETNWERERPREQRVHFSNDACVPRKQEKMLLNSSLKLGLESPSRRPTRPTSLPVASRHMTSQQRPPPEGAATRPDGVPEQPPGDSNIATEGSAVVQKDGAPVASVKRREKAAGNREDKLQYRKSCPVGPEKEEDSSPDRYTGYDVYNLEMSMPKIDWDAIENHLKSVREQERRRRNDREAIRRKLAMGGEGGDDVIGSGPASLAAGGPGRPGRKPSLQSRLQAGMNLQICFMNETASDDEEDDEFGAGSGLLARRCSPSAADPEPVLFQSLPPDLSDWPKFSQPPPAARPSGSPLRPADFVRHQAQLQAEARLALAQATQMARMQMEIERQSRKSPISDVVRTAFQKIGVPFPDGRRRVSRQLLTEMNIAQLQVIVNDFHARIEALNEALVRYLMERDEQHMEQDSKLVHIEDLTCYFGQKHTSTAGEQPGPSTTPTGTGTVQAEEGKRRSRGSLRLGGSK